MRLNSAQEWDEAGKGLCLMINTLRSERTTEQEEEALEKLEEALDLLMKSTKRFSKKFDPSLFSY